MFDSPESSLYAFCRDRIFVHIDERDDLLISHPACVHSLLERSVKEILPKNYRLLQLCYVQLSFRLLVCRSHRLDTSCGIREVYPSERVNSIVFFCNPSRVILEYKPELVS
jgi:hypothetical protein